MPVKSAPVGGSPVEALLVVLLGVVELIPFGRSGPTVMASGLVLEAQLKRTTHDSSRVVWIR